MSLRNISSPGWHVTHALFDLGPSHGALIFDTAEGPPGAGGAYNFEQTGGEAALFSLPYIIDGAEILTLLFTGFAPGASLNFMIDLDARLGGSGANVSARDVAGARLQVTLRDARGAAAQLEGAFSAQGLLALRTKCPK